ncbi:hypothetical protein [Pyruvatibacter mobilis]|uniref:hypothetical protein n=1 Tax=Pyruvatibacter mobilis TaxID=1712261 RepID=UPI003BACD1DF
MGNENGDAGHHQEDAEGKGRRQDHDHQARDEQEPPQRDHEGMGDDAHVSLTR